MQNAKQLSAADLEQRRYKRARVLFSGQLISGGHSAAGVLFDVSAGGARMRIAEPMELGSSIVLRLAEKLDFPVELAWRQGMMYGLRFREAPARIAAILSGLLPQDCLAA